MKKPPRKTNTGGLRGKLRVFTYIGFGLVLLMAGGIFSLFVIEIEDVIYAKGKIASELAYDLISPIDARVVKLNFDEGADVKKGDVIAVLDSVNFEEDELRIESEILELLAEIEVKKSEIAALRANPLPKELWYAETNVKESADRAARTEARLERSQRLAHTNAISKRELEDAEIENIRTQADYARARENLQMVKSGLGEHNIAKAERELDLIHAKIEGRRAALKLIRRRIEECKLIAPADGRIVVLPCKYTMYAEKGQIAAKFSSGNTIKGMAYVNESSVRKIRRGQVVRISSGVFNRLEYGSFSGVVDRVYDTPLEQPGNGETTKYPVEITIDSQGRPLKLGSSASFDIVAGREPVIIAILGLSKDHELYTTAPEK